MVNICTHRGATLCRKIKGSTGDFSCSFHGWTFDLDGNLQSAVSESRAGFPEGFDKSTRGLRKVRVENYRGFIFGTLNEEAEPLVDHLAETKTFIDLIVDESPQGVELLKGMSTYTYDGNWKSAAENGLDGLHVNAVHGNYVATVKNRMERKATANTIEVRNVGGMARTAGGFYDLGRGHAILWSEWPNPEASPLWSQRDLLEQRLGKVRADWATGYLRNMLIYPNVFLMDQMSTQIRVIRPLSVDKTEVSIYCFAPVGEDRASRSSDCASTRTSSTPAAWRRRMICPSSTPRTLATRTTTSSAGATSAAVRRTRSRVRTSAPRRSACNHCAAARSWRMRASCCRSTSVGPS